MQVDHRMKKREGCVEPRGPHGLMPIIRDTLLNPPASAATVDGLKTRR